MSIFYFPLHYYCSFFFTHPVQSDKIGIILCFSSFVFFKQCMVTNCLGPEQWLLHFFFFRGGEWHHGGNHCVGRYKNGHFFHFPFWLRGKSKLIRTSYWDKLLPVPPFISPLVQNKSLLLWYIAKRF